MAKRMLRCAGAKNNVQDWINLMCGALLFASPWALRFTGDPMAARTAVDRRRDHLPHGPLSRSCNSPSGRNGLR